MDNGSGRVLADRALVSDQAAARLDPPGFDPSRGKYVACGLCCGSGIVTSWSLGVKEPDECSGCYGSGLNWRYPSGVVSKFYGGPFVGRDYDGRDSDGSGGAGETVGPDPKGNSAAPQGDRP